MRDHKLVGHTGQTAGFGAAIFRYVQNDVTVITLTNLGELGMGSLVAVAAAKSYIPSLSLNALAATVTVDENLAANVSAAIRDRYSGNVNEALYAASLIQSLNSQRSKIAAERLKQYAPAASIKFVKRESVDGKDTITAIAKTSKRIFLWRAVIDESGKIAEVSLEEEE